MLGHRDSRRQRGFTLAEVMVATAIFAVIVIASLMIYDRSNRVFKDSVEAAGMQQETRVAFDKLVRDVRMAGFDFDRDGVPTVSDPTVWTPATTYASARVVYPVTQNGFVYIAVNGGQSHATTEPTWGTVAGQITTDNTIRWRAIQALYQQPDEQVEYAGLSAITIRGNLDYTTDATFEHGRENRDDADVPTYNYEPPGGEFPIVTTGNDEIVTYALKSDRAGAPNSDSIRFFADVARPREAYPGGAIESEVVIGGVDLCDDVRNGTPQCIYPPYTLYRFKLDENGAPDAGTPVASNIRSLKFFYYTTPLGGLTDTTPADGQHDELVRHADNTVIVQGAIGGLGAYDPDNVGATANYAHRAQRETIASIRVQLIGMNSAPDARYTNPNETLNPEVINYRTYQLESLIVPRNAGLRGMQEPISTTPTPPHIRSVCHGFCNATRVIWDPPVSGGVLNYEVRYGPTWTTSNRILPNPAGPLIPGDQLVAYVNIPNGTWYVNVRAYNEHGYTDADNSLQITSGSINRTKPDPVADLVATDVGTSDYIPNAIHLTWPRVTTNDTSVAANHTLACVSTGTAPSTDGTTIPSQEAIKYRIWRSTQEFFDPTRGEGVLVLDSGSGNNPSITGATTTVTWTDDKDNLLGVPPANCLQYYYRIQAYDECMLATQNIPADATHGTSEIFPPVDEAAKPGYAGYRAPAVAVAPAAPTGFRVDVDNSRCRIGPNDCSIVLVWNRVTTDTATPTPNTIAVDKYYIERQRKTTPAGAWETVGTAVLSDPEFEGNSLTNTPTITFTDTTAQHHDPTDRTRRYYYQYRVRATNCLENSAWTAFEDFPDLCGTASDFDATASLGDGSGGDPWMMSAGDYVQVTPAGGVTVTRVDFQMLDPADNSEVASASVTTAPYIFPWINSPDPDTVYPVVITVVQSTGCNEEVTRYLQDDPGLCPGVATTVSGSGGGAGLAISPYILNANDTVTIAGPIDPLDGTLGSVSFQLFALDGVTAIGAAVLDASAPFEYIWSDRTDGVVYRLRATTTFSNPAGCIEVQPDIYIKDEICTGASVAASGQLSGDGLLATTPWVMAAGATVTTTPPAGTTPLRVLYDLQAVNPAGAAEPQTGQSTGPFVFTWANRVDETVYRLTITVQYSAGCEQQIIRYIKDDPNSCKLTIDNPNGTIVRVSGVDDAQQAEIDIHNTSGVAFTITNVAITWNAWDAGITWDDVLFPSGDVVNINSSTSSTQSIDLDPRPAAFTAAEVTLNSGATMTLTMRFTESGNRDPIELTDVQKVCISYTRTDTGTRVYNCRILNTGGADASTNNPTTCD